MSQHEEMVVKLAENSVDGGSAILITMSEGEYWFGGTDTDIVSFMEAAFRVSPTTRDVMLEAAERSQCQLS